MNENNKVVDFSKVCFQMPKSQLRKQNNLKHSKRGSHFSSISKNKLNFLIEFNNNQFESSPYGILPETNQSSVNESAFIPESIELNKSKERAHINCPEGSDLIFNDKNILHQTHKLRPIINFENYNQQSNMISYNLKYYNNMLEYFDSIILMSPKGSSFSILADWFEASRNEKFYNVENKKIYVDSLTSCIAKEYIMLELISINLHLLILNKVQDFNSNLIVKFYSQMRTIFNLLKYNYTYICRIGLSSEVFSTIFKLVEVKGELDMAYINCNNKDIKKIIKSIFKLIKVQMVLDESETFCLKHLKYLMCNFQNEFYNDLKEYSYNVYLFSGVFLTNECEFERSYSISKVNNNREDAPERSKSSSSNQYFSPFLSQPDPVKGYYLILDLDETLVHCINVSNI